MSMEEIKIDMAYGVIESCSGFDDNTTSAGEAWAVVKGYINELKKQLAEERELPTIAAMWAHHNRDDEVRELRAMCDDLATQIIRCRTCMYPGDNCIGCLNDSALESYRAMATNKSKVGE